MTEFAYDKIKFTFTITKESLFIFHGGNLIEIHPKNFEGITYDYIFEITLDEMLFNFYTDRLEQGIVGIAVNGMWYEIRI